LKNINPTCYHFQTSFKSLIITNLISSHSVGANCQGDDCQNLTNLKQLLSLDVPNKSNPIKKIILIRQKIKHFLKNQDWPWHMLLVQLLIKLKKKLQIVNFVWPF